MPRRRAIARWATSHVGRSCWAAGKSSKLAAAPASEIFGSRTVNRRGGNSVSKRLAFQAPDRVPGAWIARLINLGACWAANWHFLVIGFCPISDATRGDQSAQTVAGASCRRSAAGGRGDRGRQEGDFGFSGASREFRSFLSGPKNEGCKRATAGFVVGVWPRRRERSRGSG